MHGMKSFRLLMGKAIDLRLRQETRKARHEAIAAYAAEAAGTVLDLDPDIEAAGIEHLYSGRQPDPQRSNRSPR
jgi:hypothetical protein